ncbi:hypothetical protein D043_0500A, partial [Vibrio parahaemolyticus EKP-021]
MTFKSSKTNSPMVLLSLS